MMVLYVMVNDPCKDHLLLESPHPRPAAALLGRDEPALRAASPRALNARMPLRTVCTAQHKPCAVARGLRPAALNSTI